MDPTDCPHDEALEAIAAGEPTGKAVLRHVESCDACRRTLAEVRENNSFLDTFADVLAAGRASASRLSDDPPPPDIIPGYLIEGEIHRGGHGVVYRAIQLRTKRPVAIKMLPRGVFATRRQRRRLEREAEIVAALRHPGIVTVYDGGYFADGRYGFAMEYIDGETLDRWAGTGPAGDKEQVRARLRLFAAICDAVSFAHGHGVIHRDLKPANILIDDQDSPHVLDFGIAKALQPETALLHTIARGADQDAATEPGAAFVTLPGEFAGTPAFASPEQVSGEPSTIDSRTDVYSLGVILYHLLTGQSPYPVTGDLSEVIRHIERTVPRIPSALTPCVDTDIDAVVLRALEKDKQRRYGSVAALQRDVLRCLAGEAVEARSDSAWYVLRKSVRRHRVAASVVGMAVVVLTILAGAMTLLYLQKRDAEAAALSQLRLRDIQHGRTEAVSGSAALGSGLLWRAHLHAVPAARSARFGGAIEPLDSYWALWEFYSQHPCVATIDAHQGRLYDIAIAPDGSAVATGGSDGALRLWSVPELRLLREYTHDEPVVGVRFSGDGRSIVALTRPSDVASIYDAAGGGLVASGPLGIADAVLNEDGTAAAAYGDFEDVVYVRLDGAPVVRTLNAGPGHVLSLAFSPDGDFLATTTIEDSHSHNVISTIRVWSLPDPALVAETVRQRYVTALLFAPDGRSVAWATNLAEIERWDYAEGAPPVGLADSTSKIVDMRWLADAAMLVTRDIDHTANILDLHSGGPPRVLSGVSGVMRTHSTQHGQPVLVSGGSAEGTLKLWGTGIEPWRLISGNDRRGYHSAAFSPDGRTLAYTGGVDGGHAVVLVPLDGRDGRVELTGHTEAVSAVSFSRDGRFLASASYDGTVAVWSTADGSLEGRFTGHAGRVSTAAFSPTADLLASAGDDGVVMLRDLASGRTLALEGHTGRIPAVAFALDGRLLASASADGTVRLWDAATGEPRSALTPHGGRVVRALCFSPDGSLLASGGDDDTIVLTHMATGRQEVLRGHPTDVFTLAFGPEGRVLISGDRSGGLILWDVQERRQLAVLPKHHELMMSIAVAPDGMSMLTSSAGFAPEVRLWDLAAYRPHIAGNLEHHARLVTETLGHEPANLAAMREWAAEVAEAR